MKQKIVLAAIAIVLSAFAYADWKTETRPGNEFDGPLVKSEVTSTNGKFSVFFYRGSLGTMAGLAANGESNHFQCFGPPNLEIATDGKRADKNINSKFSGFVTPDRGGIIFGARRGDGDRANQILEILSETNALSIRDTNNCFEGIIRFDVSGVPFGN